MMKYLPQNNKGFQVEYDPGIEAKQLSKNQSYLNMIYFAKYPDSVVKALIKENRLLPPTKEDRFQRDFKTYFYY